MAKKAKRSTRRKPSSKNELESFRTEYRKLVGGAIIQGLITPSDLTGGIGALLKNNHDQDGNGPYTQNGGDYDQDNAPYNQGALTQLDAIDAIRIDELVRSLRPPQEPQ